MSQNRPVQHGTFHITTNAKDHVPWCIKPGIPTIIIDNLVMTKNFKKAQLHAFCILPDHVHLIVSPGMQGLSNFMHSFKRNTMRDVRNHHPVEEKRIFRDVQRSESHERGGYEPSLRGADHAPMIAWQKSFHDERIRDARQLQATFGYVLGNAMHHGLASTQEEWPWSSIHFPSLIDPMEVWLE